SRLQVAQVISVCCVRRFVYPNRHLFGECAHGPAAGSVHFLPSLIESFRSRSASYYPPTVLRPPEVSGLRSMQPPEVSGLRYTTIVKEMFNCDPPSGIVASSVLGDCQHESAYAR